MRITQGTFSFLPDFTDEEIAAQIRYCMSKGWAMNIEFTDDIHPRNTYWEMWGLPMFDVDDPATVMYELNECRKAYPNCYIRLSAYDNSKGWESLRLSFIVHRPTDDEPGFRLERTENWSRTQRYKIYPYATDKPQGERYR